MNKFEYKVISPDSFDNERLEKELNRLGADGWQVVAMANAHMRKDQLILMRMRL